MFIHYSYKKTYFVILFSLVYQWNSKKLKGGISVDTGIKKFSFTYKKFWQNISGKVEISLSYWIEEKTLEVFENKTLL